MDWFYRSAFHLVFAITGHKDKKIHRKNPSINTVKVEAFRYLDDGDDNHSFNLISPKENKDKKPLLFDIHGGGWMYGDKNLNLDFGKYLANNDFIVALPSYTLAFKGGLQQMITELFSSLHFLLKNAEKYNIDTENIFLLGDSAGAHLSLLMTAIINSDELASIFNIDRKVMCEVKGLALLNPVPYIDSFKFVGKPLWMERGARKAFDRMMYGKEYFKSDIYNHASFAQFASKISAYPPILITTSTGDTYMGEQAIRLDKDLSNRNIDHIYFCLEDQTVPHVYNVLAPQDERSMKINEKIVDFFKSHSSIN